MPFVVGAVSEGSKNTTLQPKDIVLRLNEEPAKYMDQAKTILEKNKNKLKKNNNKNENKNNLLTRVIDLGKNIIIYL